VAWAFPECPTAAVVKTAPNAEESAVGNSSDSTVLLRSRAHRHGERVRLSVYYHVEGHCELGEAMGEPWLVPTVVDTKQNTGRKTFLPPFPRKIGRSAGRINLTQSQAQFN
jgi:hypothetical protein